MTLVDVSLWPNAYVPAVCECGHGRGMHNLRKDGARSGCSISDGPKAAPCPCKSFTPKETS